MRIQTTKLTFEDRFDRKYACWTHNHGGWRKYKRANRRALRRKLKDEFCLNCGEDMRGKENGD